MGGGLVFLGCYTPESGGGRGAGVVAARWEPATGALDLIGVVAETPSPSFLARHPALPVLYAVNELPEGRVSAWAIGAGGSLAPLGSRSTGGGSPCHLAVSPDGRYLLSANYASGSVAVHALDANGVPGERTALVQHRGAGPMGERQEGPHAHMVRPEVERVLAVDLGADRIFRYRLTEVGDLEPGVEARFRGGTGPRHLARHPDGRYFLACELDGTLAALGTDLAFRQHVPGGERRGQPSELVVGLDGRFLYLANRGPDTVAVFDITGAVPRRVAEVSSCGSSPRHLAIAGGYLYVANERSDQVIVFRLDPVTGVPEPVGVHETASPTCVLLGETS
ncbi:lactonase family protein [Rhizomonospora bruguierae]|uniref:lactonase family protein n=1 Tax=Rhizomonospora bruguierae TaxID=1581705 RepID=UPI001BCAF5F0|nr:lactonase family protein [Micromonospora sp. NBRC 107566]